MELEVTLPPSAEQIHPIFITSPCNYSGGALLQRSVCASTDGFCYGDNLFDEVLSQMDWAFELIDRHQAAKDHEQNTLENALSGSPATWMPDLAPSHEIYMASLMSGIYNLPHTAQHFAKQQDKNVWMMARAGVSAPRMNDLLALFPSSKAIFIHRNPLDVVRDALRDRPGTAINELCTNWNTMMREYLTFQSDRMLKLTYEYAQLDADAFTNTLQEFTGTTGLQGTVSDAGVEAELSSQYELSPDIEQQIKLQCGDMLAVYYPELAP